MCRLFIVLPVILLLFSCSPHLAVKQIDTKNTAVNVETAVPDSLVESFLKPYRDSIERDMSKLVCVSETAIVKGKPESKLSNLVADILFDFGTKYCNSNNQDCYPDVAYVNYGGLRGSLPLGKITVGNIFELMPFENEVVLLKISGGALEKMADKIAARGGEGISGMKLGIRDEKVALLLVGGKPVDPNAYYWLVTNDYVANGGDQMTMFADPADRKNTQMKIRDLLIKTLSERYKKEGIISVKEDGRIYNEQ
jgi:2',3'-cyclic-nucleotide 2'-phosphodiesterase (5'-nucleotidase family)